MVHKLSSNRLADFVRAISGGRTVFALEEDEKQYRLVRAEEWSAERHTLGAYRPVEPLKSLVFRPRESLGPLLKDSAVPEMQERIVIGVKSCDLSALAIHDHVFLKTDPVDPYYKQARDKTVIVACDGTDCLDVCFCPIVGERPYPREGFDINLSPTSRGIVVEAGSERGEKLLAEAKRFLDEAEDSMLRERDESRESLTKRVADQAAEKGLSADKDFRKIIAASSESDVWEKFAEDCVECGACNFVCCTCHCFLLADGTSKDNVPTRLKQWDSCLYMNFARVAGGANPRKHRAERLYNRFDKKFNFFPQVLDRYACDGCGRCIEACTGKIDIREVLKEVSG
jgi:sulfhydrogenase subunit beta (sulfur reductase)